MREAVPDPHVWIGLNRATSIDAGLDATARYVGPAQNFVLADSTGAIAIRSTGRYPVRPGSGRGDGVRDGTTRASDWTGWLPLERYPGARRPAQGFLASANQEPIDPRASSDYFGADWPAPWRAIRINTLLRADSAVTPEAMRRFQTDPGSATAEAFIPELLSAAARVLARDTSRTDLARAAGLLAEWDRRYDLTSRRAVLFEQVLQALGRLVWDELIAAGDSVPAIQPGQDVLAALMAEPASPWWDDRRTAEVEDRDALLARALEVGLARTVARYGEPGDPRWTWSGIRRMNVHHLLRIGPLSRIDIPVPSGTGTLSPSAGGGTHGASWRMVVELGPEVRAWTTFPGGQSGNPLSRWYDDRLEAWTKGDLADAYFPRAPGELREQAVTTRLSLQPGGSQ
jgi:penicillin amidase